MNSVLFSTGDVSALTGIPPNTIGKWVRAGLIEPAEGGDGRGNHARFTVAQATALAFVAEWREWGAGPPLLAPMLRHLSRFTDGDLAAAFAAGRTHLIRLPAGELSPPLSVPAPLFGGHFDRFDYRRVNNRVLKFIKTAQRRRLPPLGRTRGILPR